MYPIILYILVFLILLLILFYKKDEFTIKIPILSVDPLVGLFKADKNASDMYYNSQAVFSQSFNSENLISDNIVNAISSQNDVNKKNTSKVYNIGDLLNMPSYWAGWGRNPHNNEHGYNIFKDACKKFDNSIFYNYCNSRIDESEPIPNINRIRESVDLYIENNYNNLDRLIKKVKDPNTLCVHLRSGDKGIVEDSFIESINTLSNKYDKIIIFAGIHSDTEHNGLDDSKNNLLISISKIVIDKDIDINLENADIHLCLMRCANNLLLHKGGFSILGSILFSGNNLYATTLFEPLGNEELIDSLTAPIQLC
jgi:hypothetical protein